MRLDASRSPVVGGICAKSSTGSYWNHGKQVLNIGTSAVHSRSVRSADPCSSQIWQQLSWKKVKCNQMCIVLAYAKVGCNVLAYASTMQYPCSDFCVMQARMQRTCMVFAWCLHGTCMHMQVPCKPHKPPVWRTFRVLHLHRAVSCGNAAVAPFGKGANEKPSGD